MPTSPSSGSITSPVPDTMKVDSASATASSASSRRSTRSVRQSLASSTAARGEVAAVLLELRLEPLEEREGVGGGAREAGQDPVVVASGAPCARCPS